MTRGNGGGLVSTSIWQGCRRLLRSPAFVGASVATLSLAVGSLVAVLGFAESLWLRQAPVAQPERLAVVYSSLRSGTGVVSDVVSFKDARILLPPPPSLQGVAFEANDRFDGRGARFVLDGGFTVVGRGVSANYFDTLGVRVRGRGFSAEDAVPGAAPVAVISDVLWSHRYARRADIASGTIEVSGRRFAVIGVAAPGFRGPRRGDTVDIWVPLHATASLVPYVSAEAFLRDVQRLPLRLYARLAQQASLAQAGADVRQRLDQRSRVWNLRSLADTSYPVDAIGREREDRRLVAMLGGMAAVVLAAGVMNLAGLALARGASGQRAAAIRLALGARSRDLSRDARTETAVLAVLGGLGAVLVGRALVIAIGTSELPSGLTFDMMDPGVGPRTVLATLGLSFGLMFGVSMSTRTPVIRRAIDVSLLRGTGDTSSPRRWLMRYVLLGTHAALAVVLLASAALLARSVSNAFGRDLGFSRRALHVTVIPNLARYADAALTDVDFVRRLRDFEMFASRVSALPGVAGVAEGASPLLDPTTGGRGVAPRALSVAGTVVSLPFVVVDVGARYFSVLEIPIVAGRALHAGDVEAGGLQPVVLSAGLARRVRIGGHVLGERLVLDAGTPGGSAALQVVGIAGDVVHHGVRGDPVHAVYRLAQHSPDRDSMRPAFSLTIATRDTPAAVRPRVEALAHEAFPAAYRLRIDAVSDQIHREVAAERFGATLLGWFGVTTVLLCLVGVFSLASQLAATRSREAALHLAFGATPLHALRAVAARLWFAALLGSMLGALIAASVTPSIRTYLFVVSPHDPASFGAAIAIVLIASALAMVAPLRRLVSVSPSQLFRS